MCWLSAFALDDKSKERRDIPLKEVSRRSLLKELHSDCLQKVNTNFAKFARKLLKLFDDFFKTHCAPAELTSLQMGKRKPDFLCPRRFLSEIPNQIRCYE